MRNKPNDFKGFFTQKPRQNQDYRRNFLNIKPVFSAFDGSHKTVPVSVENIYNAIKTICGEIQR